jgi:hypothetical protein
MKKLILLAYMAAISVQLTWPETPAPPPLPAGVERALAAVSAGELKGDLSFLASDTLQGRFTPSPGLEVAAEFIASKFRAAGLEPGGDHDYFQIAEMVDRRLPVMTGDLTLFTADRALVAPPAEMTVEATSQAAHLDHAPVVFFAAKDPALLKDVDLTGKAVVAVEADLQKLSGDQMRAERRKARAFDQAVASSGALLNLTILHNKRTFTGPPRLLFMEQAAAGRTPTLAVHSEELAKFVAEAGHQAATLSVDIPAPLDNKVIVKNVIGILRGSDPLLAKTAVLLTAHYDHIGTIETAGQMSMRAAADSPDRIYNGANDDGSGTVSVIEIARALAKIQPHPKRSIVFMTFFGEERGELGSQFYGKHPVFPIGQTVADVNLEQVGRTDSTVGRQLNNASVTGFDYSDVTGFLQRAGERVGIKVYRDAQASDAYFTRSDNDALAEQGVPAHTLCVAFDYPDYHGLGDEWPKVDYENMAKVDRMVLLALFDLANSEKAPEWNAQNPKTEHFRAARAASQGGR